MLQSLDLHVPGPGGEQGWSWTVGSSCRVAWSHCSGTAFSLSWQLLSYGHRNTNTNSMGPATIGRDCERLRATAIKRVAIRQRRKLLSIPNNTYAVVLATGDNQTITHSRLCSSCRPPGNKLWSTRRHHQSGPAHLPPRSGGWPPSGQDMPCQHGSLTFSTSTSQPAHQICRCTLAGLATLVSLTCPLNPAQGLPRGGSQPVNQAEWTVPEEPYRPQP